ncbi:MAG: type III-A CRISPR-associated protein Csm2 [Methylovulum sp.]|nr:type III-A CRISPR-associated protein Csm2 [Methylovulum sp.]
MAQANYSHSNQSRDREPPFLNVTPIQFAAKSADLFDEVANQTAITIADSGDKNKSTQLRKYYDELCMWDQKIKQDKQKYVEYLPLIKMLNAKVAYANGRKLVDDNFVKLMRHCLSQLNENEESFKTCKLFFEAFMGFYKMHKPK